MLRVAIVELRDTTYIGRLFFGDSETGSAVWDCDCRPSDGCWLALKVFSIRLSTTSDNDHSQQLIIHMCDIDLKWLAQPVPQVALAFTI